jgi:peptidoglycan/LPS O-acetylase OafA/YrhL
MHELRGVDSATIHFVEAQSSKRFYAPELDSLRFVAFLAVFVFHARGLLSDGLSPPLKSIAAIVCGAGAFGVDLFFVLSAYLITELLLREKDLTGTLNFRGFYARRILRIWPLYFFFLGLASLLPLVVSDQHFGWKYLVGFSVLAGNWVIVLLGVPGSVANILWSVSIEEQFYLCWPLVVSKLSKTRMVALAVSLLLVSNVTRFSLYHFGRATNQSVWFNTITHLDPIVLGILLALVIGTRPSVVKGFWRLILLGGSMLALLAVSAFADLNANMQPMSALALFAYPSVAVSCLAILVATLGTRIRIARSAILLYLGKISYGLYVYHFLGLWLAQRLFGTHRGFSYSPVCALTAFVMTVGCASLSYRFLESPFLQLKKRFTYIPSRPV